MTEPIEDWIRDPDKRRKKLVKAAIFLFCAVGVAVSILVLLWLNGWWPDKLIPFLPFERV